MRGVSHPPEGTSSDEKYCSSVAGNFGAAGCDVNRFIRRRRRSDTHVRARALSGKVSSRLAEADS
jgi:hypothetical protein